MRVTSSIFQTFWAAIGLCSVLTPAPADAYNNVSFNTLALNANGQCNAAVNSSFNVFFWGDPTTADFAGEDYFAIYLVDGAGSIIGRQNGSFNAAAGLTTVSAVSRTTNTPAAGAFTVYFVDEPSAGYSANLGDAFALSSLASHSFDPSVYDADCVGGAVGGVSANSGGSSGGAGSNTVASQVVRAQNDLTQTNLQRQVSRLTSGGGVGAVAGSGAAGGGGADPVGSGGISTNTIDEDDDYQRRAREIAKELAEELATQFDSDPSLSASFAMADDAKAPFPLLQPSKRPGLADRAALKALASRLDFSTAGMGSPAQVAAFEGDVGPVEPIVDGVEVATSLPERRDLNFFVFGSYSIVDNGRNVGGDDRRFSGDAIAATAGVDRRVAEGLTVGVSLSAITTELETYFNAGEYEDLTFAGGPYVVYQPTERLVITASGGYAFSQIEQSRDDKSVAGETEAHAAFGNLDIEFRAAEGDQLRLKSGLRLSGAYKYTDSFIESDSTRVAGRRDATFSVEPNLEVAWREPAGGALLLEPFATIAAIWDLGDAINQDNEAIVLGGGLRLVEPASGFSSELGAKTELGRDDYDAHSFYGSVSYGYSPSGDDALSAALNLSGDEEAAGLSLNVSYAPGDVLPDAKISLALDNRFDGFDVSRDDGPHLRISFSASF